MKLFRELLQVQALRRVSAGQGLMLECSSARLLGPGMPHHNCPDKVRPQFDPSQALYPSAAILQDVGRSHLFNNQSGHVPTLSSMSVCQGVAYPG